MQSYISGLEQRARGRAVLRPRPSGHGGHEVQDLIARRVCFATCAFLPLSVSSLSLSTSL